MGPHVVGVNFFATNFFYSDYFKKMHNTDHTVYFNFFFYEAGKKKKDKNLQNKGTKSCC